MAAAAIGFSDQALATKLRVSVPWRWAAVGSWALCAALGLGAGKIWFAWKPVTDVLVGLSTASLLVHVTACAGLPRPEQSRLFALLSSKPLVTIGHFSYSLYLTHLPVMALCYFALLPLHWAPGTFALLLVAVSTTASFAIGYVFHLAFERPFMVRR